MRQDRDWCILRTSPGKTIALMASLVEAGFEAWTPTETREKRAGPSRARVDFEVPITPTFVFARYTRLHELAALSRSPSLTFKIWDRELRRMVTKGHPYFTLFRDGDHFGWAREAELRGLRDLEAHLRKLADRRRKAVEQEGPAPRFAAGEIFRMPDSWAFAGLDLTVTEANAGKMVRLAHAEWNFSLEISAWSLKEIQILHARA